MEKISKKTPPPAVGSVFRKLTVIGEHVTGPDGNYIPCQCECGRPLFVLWRVLNSDSREGCGHCRPLYKKERLYNTWGNMKCRCANPTDERYRDYGGRGIRVCAEWQKYPAFRAWAMANGYEEGLTIERVDVNGNYEPSNCTWIPKADQARNRRSNIYFEYDGERKILKDWSDDPRCGVGYHTLYSRLQRDDWDFEYALTAPLGSRKPKASD